MQWRKACKRKRLRDTGGQAGGGQILKVAAMVLPNNPYDPQRARGESRGEFESSFRDATKSVKVLGSTIESSIQHQ